MRHFGSLVAGLVVAPLAWVLIAAGQPRMERIYDRWSTADEIYTGDVLRPLGLVLGAGLLLGLIVALRLSPVGPLVAGVLYLGVYGYALREPTWVVDTLPRFEINGYPVDTVPPFTNGTIALAGAILVVAALSRRRWQRWPSAVPAAAPGTAPGSVPGPGSTGVLPVPESPAPAGAGAYSPAGMPDTAAAYTPNETVAGPPPALGDGPLWPSTTGPAPAYSRPDQHPADGSTLTREAMYAGLTPGTPEDLPRRTPPKRPAETGSGTDPFAGPTAPPADGGPSSPPVAPDSAPTAGQTPPVTPPAAPVIPSPRHAAAAEGWPLDTWPGAGPADRPTIQPTFRVPPESPSTDLTQPVPPPVPPVPPSAERTQPTPSAAPTQPTTGQPAPTGPDAGPPDPAPPQDTPTGAPPQRPVNPLAPQRPVSPPPSTPPRPRPVNPLAQRPPVTPPVTPPETPSDATQRLPGQQPPTTDDPEERPGDPPATSPWAAPPRPPQDG
jgi:hypothetical protein